MAAARSGGASHGQHVRVLTREMGVHLGKGLSVAGRENLFERDAFALKELALPSDFTF